MIKNDPFEDEILSRMYAFHRWAEGAALESYLDSKGILTVGIGHNCVASPVPGVAKPGDSISESAMRNLYEQDTHRAVRDLDKYLPWWRQLSAPRAAVLFDLCFNMGIGVPPCCGKAGKGLRSFHKSLPLIEQGRYVDAAGNFRKSGWYRDVKARRAEPLLRQLETGTWQI